MAFQNLVHAQGELAVAKATSSHGTIMTVSTLSTSSLRDIKKSSSISPWFQVYIYKDREITKNLIKQADKLNYGAIVLTVDTPFYAKRMRELKNPISFKSHSQVINLVETGLKLDNINPSVLPQYLSSLLESNIGWKDIEWIRSITSLPIILKGILHPDDVQMAINHNIQGVVLSNHGGRQLDTAITALESLSMLNENTKNEIDIIIDGGIRKGTDILKAFALGARAVMIGRPIIWGLAVNGEEGVYQVLDILKKELYMVMALSGIASVVNLDGSIHATPH
jgi:4-hydroxymandelate oxidase